ncbi:MAG: cell wall hydrolase [Eubacteriales bacterium]|nr:cell wall hydrolase [Eubacteriales bacterium]
MDMIKQHRILSAVTIMLIITTLVIWLTQDLIPVYPLAAEQTETGVSTTEQAQAGASIPGQIASSERAAAATNLETAESDTPDKPISPAPEPVSGSKYDPEPTVQPAETDANGIFQERVPVTSFASDQTTVYIRVFNANIREEPRTDVPIVDQLSMGDSLSRSGYGEYWSQVITEDNEIGYILTDLISTEVIYKPKPSPTPAPTAVPAQPSEQKAEPASAPAPAETESTDSSDADDQGGETPEEPVVEKTEEFELFARVISLEGHQPSGYDSYLSVASVIMNHVAHPAFPNTVTGVLSRSNAFYTYSKAAAGIPETYSNVVYQAAVDAYYHNKRNLPSYVIAFATPEAYERNVASGGSFSKMEVYQVAYAAVWCYYERDVR